MGRGATAIDLTGRRFGDLVVLRREDSNKPGKVMWRCACECGAECTIPAGDLRSGKQKHCSARCPIRAAKQSVRHKTHGQTETPEYAAWQNAVQRTTNPRNPEWRRYGGRGIRMCFESFAAFVSEVGPRPSPAHSIDRIDNNGNYERGNLRWATKTQQTHNRRARRST